MLQRSQDMAVMLRHVRLSEAMFFVAHVSRAVTASEIFQEHAFQVVKRVCQAKPPGESLVGGGARKGQKISVSGGALGSALSR
jgi:hypothetical protein